MYLKKSHIFAQVDYLNHVVAKILPATSELKAVKALGIVL